MGDLNLQFWPIKIPKKDIYIQITIPGRPVSKQRPRFSKKKSRVYTPKGSHDAEQNIKKLIKEKYPRLKVDEVSDFEVRCYFVYPDKRRRDIDNAEKLVFDALNNLVWKDDTQVGRSYKEKFPMRQDITPKNIYPRTELLIRKIQKA